MEDNARGHDDDVPVPSLVLAVAALVAECPAELQQYVFPPIPIRGHVWEDAYDVFSLAASEFEHARNPGATTPFPGDEHPLLFIGAHIKGILSEKRHAIGFLLTDRALLVRNSAVKGSEQAAMIFPLSPGFQVSHAADRFDWSWLERLARHDGIGLDELRKRLTLVLTQAIGLVLPTVGTPPAKSETPDPTPVRQTAEDIAGRLRELGLSALVKLGRDPKHAKHLTKLRRKIGMPDAEPIIVAISDATFAGPYGTVITATRVCSRDLMEDPDPPTERTTITPADAVIEGDKLILGSGRIHTIPSTVQEAQRGALQVFIRELLSGALTE